LKPQIKFPNPADAMKVSDSDVLHVAELANLELTAEEGDRMLRDLNSILEYVDRLNQLDTSGVPPMAQVSERYGVAQHKTGSEGYVCASRADILHGLRPSLERQDALKEAPKSDGTFFKVPKVIER
jgi:aspartyl-tRNA(Asn)/glutamyl-tRNA(Gln) amidotransferase subunit C